jgi:tripartite-type tricarboxylate transporter receptor subunit TctC
MPAITPRFSSCHCLIIKFHWKDTTVQSRRMLLASLAGAALAGARSAAADAFPSRPVRLIVGFAAGGPADILARLIGRSLSERLGQPCVIDNRPGAGANIGTEAVVRAPADGYTLLWVGSTNAINATLYEKLNYDFIRDITPVASISRMPLVLTVNPSVPATTVPELVAYAKASRGKLNYGSAGNGTPMHVSGELFKMMAGVDMVHVPYRGEAPAVTDLLGGQVHALFGTIAATVEHIRAGTLRALGVTSATRSSMLPDVPTVGDFLPGYEASGWFGVGAPRNTPTEIINRLSREINAGLADPTIKLRFAELGSTVFASTPNEFGELIAEQTEKWRKVVKFAGIKPL